MQRPPLPPNAPAPEAASADPGTDPAPAPAPAAPPAPAPAVPEQAPKATRGLLQTAACAKDNAACAPQEAAYANYYSRLRCALRLCETFKAFDMWLHSQSCVVAHL